MRTLARLSLLLPLVEVAVVVMNPTSKGGDYHLVVGGASVHISSRPHSIQTVVF